MKRFQFLLSLLDGLQKPTRMLDIGGTQAYWNMMGFSDDGINITLLNLQKEEVNAANFDSVAGDATDLHQYADQSFDVVYSNSVIEHLFNREAQQKMADEIRRVGKNYFVQTPNYYFPIEPHWVFPFFQFFPHSIKVWLTRNFSLGHIGRKTNRKEAEEQVNEIRLLTKKEMRALFPDAKIYEEKFLFFTKSVVAYRF